jgi:hypothetical protein
MNKLIVKKGRKIIGYCYQQNDSFWYVFGKPSQNVVISFECSSLVDGMKKILKKN